MQSNTDAQVNTKAYRDSIFNKYAANPVYQFKEGQPYYVVAWDSTIPQNINIVRQLGERVSIVALTSQQAFYSLQQVRIAKAGDWWKFSPSAALLLKNTCKEQTFIISSYNTDTLFNLLQTLKSDLKIISVNRPSHSIVVKATGNFIQKKLLPLKEVLFIDVRAEPHTEISVIGYDRSFDGLNAVDYSIPGADGKNIVTGVKEQKIDESDLDLYKRVLPSPISSANITNHATVIATLIGGAGNRFYDGRGIAYACHFFSSSFENLFADDAAILNANGVTLQNHSYGTIIQQFYGAEAVSYDADAWQNKNFVHVFSAGNEGTSIAVDGPYVNIPGFANLTGNFKTAKNVITVGAMDNKGNIPAQSSAGPLYDGRLAPQLIALGPGGTSDAAAIVSGTVAVMQQVYADSNAHAIPAASLIKAVLYNTAEDVYNTGIDYKTGYGLLNSYAAIRSIQQKEYNSGFVANDQYWTKNIIVPANAAQLKITLAWTDSAATLNNNKALINDLDLEVQELNTRAIYKPWVLNTSANANSLSAPPTRRRDSLNTSEQVSIPLPAAGTYQVKVIGSSVSTPVLPFHIAYHVDTLNTFVFTSPQHASDVNREEDPYVFIKWKTFVADSNQTGNLYISYNGGTSWQLLQQSLKLYTNQYQWLIKDTNSRAVLKMETSFGNFLSKEFIISQELRPSVDFFCADSFRLSWNKYVYADAYKIYTLTDSPYLKDILTVSDTFVVIKRSLHPELVYAVEPVLSNKLPAARSIALNVAAQGVQCFYKTFYYNLLGGNNLELVLELGAPDYIDSVFFEQVTANGEPLQTYSGTKVNSSSIYKRLISSTPTGTSYWKASIKLKNGAVLYTEIISVLTSGKKYIFFYPNPVLRYGSLKYMLQQDLPSDSKLQLFDITGRLLKNYEEMPNNIDLQTFAPGVFIYKLFSSDNHLLETGKLVVQ
ncbi:S8 family peptidase [Ilyomonas limi]|nr:S8 family peptidase [Ilyomonas limi]